MLVFLCSGAALIEHFEFSDLLERPDNVTQSAGWTGINLVAIIVHKFPICVSGIDLSHGCVCVCVCV